MSLERKKIQEKIWNPKKNFLPQFIEKKNKQTKTDEVGICNKGRKTWKSSRKIFKWLLEAGMKYQTPTWCQGISQILNLKLESKSQDSVPSDLV